MHRLLVEDPVTRAGPLARHLALFSLLATGIALLVVRDPRADVPAALTALAAGLCVAILAIVAAIFAFVRVWQDGARGLGAAIGGLVLAVLVLGYPAYAGLRGARLPAEPDRAARDRQRKAYPQIAPLTLDIDADQAFELARQAALKRRWQIVEAIRPGGRMGQGRIDAIARGLVLNLPDDVTVRVRPRADGARIDVRSASRLGSRDFGGNADRIRAYLDDVSNLALTAK